MTSTKMSPRNIFYLTPKEIKAHHSIPSSHTMQGNNPSGIGFNRSSKEKPQVFVVRANKINIQQNGKKDRNIVSIFSACLFFNAK